MSEATTKPPFGYKMEKLPIPELLAGFEDLLAAATQLPDNKEWHWAGNCVRNSHDHEICCIEEEVPYEPGYGKRSLEHMKATAQFIAAARNGMLILIDTIKALQSEVAYLQRSFCGEQEQNTDLRAKLEAAERERRVLGHVILCEKCGGTGILPGGTEEYPASGCCPYGHDRGCTCAFCQWVSASRAAKKERDQLREQRDALAAALDGWRKFVNVGTATPTRE